MYSEMLLRLPQEMESQRTRRQRKKQRKWEVPLLEAWVTVSLWERMETQRIWRWRKRGRGRKEKGSRKKRKKKLMTTFKIQQLLVNHTVIEFSSIFRISTLVQYKSSLSLSLPVPAIDPIPTERFPEYVRDMLYGEENKLKAEFSVRYPYMVILRLVYGYFLSFWLLKVNGHFGCFSCMFCGKCRDDSHMCMFTYTGPGKATSTTLYCGSPASQQGTQQIQKHLSM